MPINIKYQKKTIINTSANLVLFSDEKFKTDNLKKYVSGTERSYITDLLKNSDHKKNVLVFDLNSKKEGCF